MNHEIASGEGPDTRTTAGLRSAVVTGVGGFIGSHLAQALLASGVHVTGIDSRAALEQGVEENLQDCFRDKRFRFIRADIRRAEVRPLVSGCDVVFHLAALTGVRSSWGERFEDYLGVNVLGTHRLLRACDQAGVSHLVLASSSSVYGGTGHGPSTEGDEASPRSPYGVSKLASEQLALAFAHSPDTTTRVTALRYFSVYGPRQRPDMLISQVLDAAMTGRQITVFGDGSQQRDFTFVEDVVAATMAAAHLVGTSEVVNVGAGRPRTVDDVLATAGRLTGASLRINYRPVAAGDVDKTWADTAKAARLLNHSTTRLEDGMAAHWMWMTTGHRRTTRLGGGSPSMSDTKAPAAYPDGSAVAAVGMPS